MTYSKIEVTMQTLTGFPKSGDVKAWLDDEEVFGQYLLAHSLGGVVWGYKGENGWVLSDKVLPIALDFNWHTLTQLRVFDETHELFVWREGEELFGRTIMEGQGNAHYYVSDRDEHQILWGTKPKNVDNDFTVLCDGQQGMEHAFPLKIPADHFQSLTEKEIAKGERITHRPAELHVRHYIEVDSTTGLTRIKLSRLVNISTVSMDKRIKRQTEEEKNE